MFLLVTYSSQVVTEVVTSRTALAAQLRFQFGQAGQDTGDHLPAGVLRLSHLAVGGGELIGLVASKAGR